MSQKLDQLFFPTNIYSSTELEIEGILPKICDFSLVIPGKSESKEKSLSQMRNSVAPSETIKIHVLLKPNFKNTAALKKFKILFDVSGDETTIWMDLFKNLHIRANITQTLPSSVDNEMKLIHHGDIISSYVYRPKSTLKKVFCEEGSSDARVGVEVHDGLLFELDIHVPKRLTGETFIVLDLNIFSRNYEVNTIKSFSDLDLGRSKTEKSLGMNSSTLYMDSLLYLGSIAKPMKIVNPLMISSTSKLLNSKGVVQCLFENTSDSKICLKTFAIHVLSSKIQPIVDPLKYRDVVTSLKEDMQLEPLKSPFNFVYEAIFPVVLEAGEKYSMLLQIFPNHVEINETMHVYKSPFVEYSTLITMDYDLGDIGSFSRKHFIKWNHIQEKGIIVSIDSPPHVKVGTEFPVSVVVKNFLSRKCDFTMKIQGSSTSAVYCVENVINVGVLDTHQIKKINLNYFAKRGGTWDIFDVILHDKLNDQSFKSVCGRKVFVEEIDEESPWTPCEDIQETTTKSDFIVPDEDWGVLANRNVQYDDEMSKVHEITPFQRKLPAIPIKRVAQHHRSKSTDTKNEKPVDSINGPYTPGYVPEIPDSFRARSSSTVGVRVSTPDIGRRKSIDGEEIDLDSPRFVDEIDDDPFPEE